MVVTWLRRAATLINMSYLALARKYRPQQFAEMVGQAHVANTLLNAFKMGKVGQAYLFTGTRGVGKTSAARILAKALRCEDPASKTGGANPGSPCDKCPSCLEIAAGGSIDVLEIDGASNNGVENVREIRESVKFMPSRGTIKVYIIDEVHMLTGAAWNALLKTLEEPPAHVTFILATTEVQKIPATILSRCQRFDFKRVPQAQILEAMRRLCDKESVKADTQGLRMIARKAEGSMRDALSTLDQVIALSGKELSAANVTESLGILGTGFLAGILRDLFGNRPIEAIRSVEKAFDSGVEMKMLAVELSETLRVATLLRLGADSALLELSDEECAELTEATRPVTSETLQAAFKVLSSANEEILRSQMPRTSLEMTLIRIAGLGNLMSFAETIQKTPKAAISTSKAPEPAPTPAPARTAPVAAPASVSPPTAFDWKDWVAFVTEKKPSLGALLEHAALVSAPSATDSRLVIGFLKEHGFYLTQAQTKPSLAALEQLLTERTGLKARVDVQPMTTAPAPTLAESTRQDEASRVDTIKKSFLQHGIASATKEIFGVAEADFDVGKSK